MLRCDLDVVGVDGDCVFFHDLDRGRRSVTNDMENVIPHIRSLYPGKRLIYRDSMNEWCEIHGDATAYLIRPFKGVLPSCASELTTLDD